VTRQFLGFIAVAAIASSAAAISLAPLPALPGQTGSEGHAVTSDGSAVVGLNGAGTSTTGVFWSLSSGSDASVSPSSPTAIVAGGAWAFSTATGIGIRVVGGQQQLVVYGLSSGWGTNAYSTDGGATWLQGYRESVGSGPNVGAANTLGAGGIDDTFFDCFNSDAGGTNLYIQKFSGATPTLISRDAKGTTQVSRIVGVSATGKGVGRRKGDSTNYWNYKLAYNGTGGLTASYFSGLDGSNRGEAWAISGDGNKIFGMSPVTGKTGSWPYMRDDVAGTIVALPTLNAAAAYTTNGVVYGSSTDGRWAVGMDYTLGVERAVLWDTLSMTELDLTDWASNHGILGAFTGNLRRAHSVGVNSAGQVVIVGYGSAPTLNSSNTGFVLALPEPATAVLAIIAGAVLALVPRRAI
jgi:hypothetical protein